MEVDQVQGDYFESYEDLEVHKLMLEDKVRNQAYRKAIFDNADYIKGKTIMDVGAGTGILSIYCAQAGAAKVYAVEASKTYKIAIEIVKENGFENIIEVIHDKVENVILPGDVKVDAIVSEWMGFYLLHEGMLDSVITARDKFLKKDGILFPESATLHAAPCSVPSMYDFWEDVDSVSMKSFAQKLRQHTSQKLHTDLIKPENILAIPDTILWLDLREITHEDLNKFNSKHVFVCSKPGRYQGLTLWFYCTFPSNYTEPVVLSTDPDDPPTHWKQTTVVFPNEALVEQDEPLAVEISMERSVGDNRRYNVEVTMLDTNEVEHPEYCNCYMTKCILQKAVLKKYENNEFDS